MMYSAQEITARANFASRIATDVGKEVLALRSNHDQSELQIRQKGDQDFVTFADGFAEDAIKRALSEEFPDDGFLGEETGGAVVTNGIWVVDPIDGTTNYIRGMSSWAVSIAFVADNCVDIGVIYEASLDRLYSAVHGSGAFVNGSLLDTTRPVDLTSSIAVLGMTRDSNLELYLNVIKTLHYSGVEHRRFGASTIDLLHVATGLIDGCLEMGIRSWDVLAGLLIAKEAGCVSLAPVLNEFLLEPSPILCGHEELIALIRQCAPDYFSNLVPLNSRKT